MRILKHAEDSFSLCQVLAGIMFSASTHIPQGRHVGNRYEFKLKDAKAKHSSHVLAVSIIQSNTAPKRCSKVQRHKQAAAGTAVSQSPIDGRWETLATLLMAFR